jgi:hypothetical protein
MAAQVGTHRQEGFPTLRIGIERHRWIELSDVEKKHFLEEKIGMAIDALDCSGVIPSLWTLTWINAAIASADSGSFEKSLQELSDAVSPDPMPDGLMSVWLSATQRSGHDIARLRCLLASLKQRQLDGADYAS